MLKAKEKLFGYYFHKLRNVKEAAVKAGFNAIFAERTGTKLIARTDVKNYIAKLDERQKMDSLYFDVISGLKRLSFGEVNDSVKLIFKDGNSLGEVIDDLDLFHISEMKKPKENALEIKFFDRYKALELLCKLMENQQNQSEQNSFYEALENSAVKLEEIKSHD